MPLRKLDLAKRASGTGWSAVRFDGWVELRVSGTILSGETLPEGFRPTEQTYFPVSGQQTGTQTPRVSVTTNGVMTPQHYTTGWGLTTYRAA